MRNAYARRPRNRLQGCSGSWRDGDHSGLMRVTVEFERIDVAGFTVKLQARVDVVLHHHVQADSHAS